MSRRRISETERARIFAAADGICHICEAKIDGGRERWDVEHVIPLEMGGGEVPGSANLQPAHAKCHADKTKRDQGHIAKAKRMNRRAMGIKPTRKHPLPGSRASGWKRKLDGTVERRDADG